ncbi:MAG TPA: flagellar basal body protein FliL [Nitrospinae bacterium]|nr:flagellar basal body protein FliL [Nitrospinota bacterium]
MAEAPEDQEAAQEEPSKGGAMKWIIISLVATLVLGGGGFAVWWFVLSGDDKKADVVKKKGEGGSEASLPGPIVSLKTFIVNLADPGGRRYLKVKLDLELTTKDSEKELKGRLPEVRDQIILALSSKTYQQIQGIAGKTVLREELTARMNSVLKKGQVKKTYFTEFVVQ